VSLLKRVVRALVGRRAASFPESVSGTPAPQPDSQPAPKSLINLDIYRVEAKNSVPVDERHYHCRGNGLEVLVRPAPQYPYTQFRVEAGGRVFEDALYYGHLALARLIAEYPFSSVLDIGSRDGTSARLFQFLGKDVTTIEIDRSFDAQYSGDYLEANFGRQFDAIWCSHVLEHQRYPGRFLDKLFDDLKEGGVVAISIPSALSPLMLGHCYIWTPLHLIYNLVGAGFDCRQARAKCYDWQVSVLVKKKSSGVPRISIGSTAVIQGHGDKLGWVPGLLDLFPPLVSARISVHGHIWGEMDEIGWDSVEPAPAAARAA